MSGREIQLPAGVPRPRPKFQKAAILFCDMRYEADRRPADALPMTGRYSMMCVVWVGPEDGLYMMSEEMYMAAPDILDCLPWVMERVDEEGLPRGAVFFRRSNAERVSPGGVILVGR